MIFDVIAFPLAAFVLFQDLSQKKCVNKPYRFGSNRIINFEYLNRRTALFENDFCCESRI